MSQMEKKQSRQRLRPWLECHANAGTFQGLKWLKREEKIFSISWRHQNNKHWDASLDTELFKAWALYTGKWKEGDPENPPEWKTRLRTALTKLSNIEERKDLHNLPDPDNPNKANPVNPYKAYQFLDDTAINSGKGASQSSPHSESGYSDSSSTAIQASPSSQVDFLEMSDTEMESGARCMDQHSGLNDMNNIPTVVLEKCHTMDRRNIGEVKLSNLPTPDYVSYENSPSDVACFLSDYPASEMHPTNTYANGTVPQQQEPLPQDIQGQFEEMHPNNAYASGTAPQPSESLPQDLQDIQGLMSLNTNITPSNMSIGSSLPSMDSLPSTSQNHVLKMQVYCFGKLVKEEFIDHEARLFCGDWFQHVSSQTTALPVFEKAFGSNNLRQIAIPDIDKIPNLSFVPKQRQKIKDIQNNMDRGLLIGGNLTQIYTLRLCKAHVSIWTQNKTIEKLGREGNSVVHVFDMELFKQQLHEYSATNACQPSPSVVFIFGQLYKGDQQILDMSQVYFCVKITHLEAARLLQRVLDLETNTNEDLASKSNPEDALADKLKATLSLANNDNF